MARYTQSRLMPVILVIIITIIAVVAIVALARAVFFSGNSSTQTATQTSSSQESLLSTAVDRQVRMTVRGAIVADEEFHSYRVAVTPASRSMTTYKGYLETQVDTVTLGNNIPAYEQFVHALDKANLTKGTPFTGDEDDTRGICATGRVYEFELLKGEESVERLWTSTCSGSRGSLDASVEQLRNLFFAQIPDASTIVRKVNLGQTSSSLF